ncbi:hypothetical protein [Roseateles asaccharophilus]|uniref:Uncharacterized protein YciI n=1 Tax=Roseateles asaccharophilus TaxID=582607 RepID=A0ABU2A8W0_9BURK|nr:hypothetical protein [Roseateles asaccharophilus]MDR7333638.1 uncharacterized protein YciI [Roseateles asaccharophilus]
MLPALSRRAWALLAAGLGLSARAQTPPAAEPAPLPLFAVQVRTGPRWDAAKPPTEQAFFREHSAHLKKLRDAGHIVVGARYADVGLLVVAAAEEATVRALMDEDPSMKAETLRFDVHPFNVFYGGTLLQRPRRT